MPNSIFDDGGLDVEQAQEKAKAQAEVDAKRLILEALETKLRDGPGTFQLQVRKDPMTGEPYQRHHRPVDREEYLEFLRWGTYQDVTFEQLQRMLPHLSPAKVRGIYFDHSGAGHYLMTLPPILVPDQGGML